MNNLAYKKNMSQQKISTIVIGIVNLKKDDAELFAKILKRTIFIFAIYENL